MLDWYTDERVQLIYRHNLCSLANRANRRAPACDSLLERASMGAAHSASFLRAREAKLVHK